MRPEEIRDSQKKILESLGAAKGKSLAGDERMNKTETAYADHLHMRRLTGEIQWFAFEAVKFRLATKCFYTPDFLVMLPDNSLQIHEVKGWMQDDAAVKLRMFVELYPMFPLKIVRWKKKQWEIEER